MVTPTAFYRIKYDWVVHVVTKVTRTALENVSRIQKGPIMFSDKVWPHLSPTKSARASVDPIPLSTQAGMVMESGSIFAPDGASCHQQGQLGIRVVEGDGDVPW